MRVGSEMVSMYSRAVGYPVKRIRYTLDGEVWTTVGTESYSNYWPDQSLGGLGAAFHALFEGSWGRAVGLDHVYGARHHLQVLF
jgi:hypothetical protein